MKEIILPSVLYAVVTILTLYLTYVVMFNEYIHTEFGITLKVKHPIWEYLVAFVFCFIPFVDILIIVAWLDEITTKPQTYKTFLTKMI